MAKIKKSEKSAGAVSKSSTGAEPSREMRRLEEVFRLMTSYGVGEVELEDENGRLHARMPSAAPVYSSSAFAPQVPAASPSPVSAPSPSLVKDASASAAKSVLPSNQKKILSPFVGTFYRSSNPNSAPYVSEGQRIRKGQTLCIIEAMKLMNEIESEFEGKIVSVLVENGQPVEFGEPLFVIES
jgi:acetyl-CoA carboxylase biotin carboxyl carrier protein